MSCDNGEAYNLISDQFIQAREQMSLPKLLIRFAELVPSEGAILDIGCGSGVPITEYLVNKGFQVLAIDISIKLLEAAQKNIPNGRFMQADIAEFSTKTRFQGILAYDSLFHLRYQEHEKVFRKLYDFLEDKGYLLFTHGGSEGEITGEMFGHEFSYSSLGPEKTERFLTRLGFRVIEWKLNQSNDPSDNGHLTAIVQKISHL